MNDKKKPLRFAAWLLGAGLGLTSIALAGPPAPDTQAATAGAPAAPAAEAQPADAGAPNPQALGIAESALNYCAPVDSEAAERLRQLIRHFVQGASQEKLTEVRNSDEYRQAYDAVADVTGRIDPQNAKRFCSEQARDRG